MIEQLLWAIVLSALTVTCHVLYSAYLVHRLRKHNHPNWKFSKASALYIQIHSVVMLLLLHCVETVFWAAFFVYKGGIPEFAEALYFSIVSYATIGYGDVVLPASLRLVGAIEGVVGTLMAGWSVALLVGILQTLLRANHSEP